MNTYLINTIALLGAFFSMEGVAWFTHKYIMHGILWFLHEDHHHKGEEGFIEKNDAFFLFFAIPGIICILTGMFNGYNFLFWIGLGITLYGLTYFLVHDVFIHRRLDFIKNSESVYFRAIRKAHKVHHKHLGKEHGECFGMLWVPLKYFYEASRAQKQ